MAAVPKAPSTAKTTTTPTKPKPGFIRRAYRACYKAVTSHLGLLSFLIIFNVLGAVIFQAIEGDNEQDEKADIQWLREQIIDKVWNSSSAVKRNEQAFRLLLRLEMKKYEAQLYATFMDGINTSTETEVWDFWGSLFYCATVYTTIGYGNIFPATDVGRVVTIIYSLIGIPLCLIVLADLGKLFTRAIKWFWSFIRRFYYTRRWSRAGAKKVVEEKAKQAASRHPEKTPVTPAAAAAPAPQPEIPVFVVDDEFNLPVSVAIIITFLYILLGAFIYCQWEDWDYLEAFYFVFISVSTIGFGDVLPEHPKYFLMSSIYVLVGLSLVAMVINVIMEAMAVQLDTAQRNIAEIARNVGIGIDEDETDQAATQNGAAKPQAPITATTMTPVATPAITPAASTSSLQAPIKAPSHEVSPSPGPMTMEDPRYGPQTSGPPPPQQRGRMPYRDTYPDDYRRQDAREYPDPYERRGPPQDYRGDPRGDPRMDPRGDPRMDPRSPADPRGDPRMMDPRGDPRMDPRGDPRMDPRGDPRMDPRSPVDPRGDPRLAPRTPEFGGPRQQYVQ